MPIFNGESIEEKVCRILEKEEPITDTAEPIYTDYADDVPPSTDIRTDKFEVALNAIDATHRENAARAMMTYKERMKNEEEEPAKEPAVEVSAEPKQGTLEATGQQPS